MTRITANRKNGRVGSPSGPKFQARTRRFFSTHFSLDPAFRSPLSKLPRSLPLILPIGLPAAGYPASARWPVFKFLSAPPVNVLPAILGSRPK
jgi:hypothetical protein